MDEKTRLDAFDIDTATARETLEVRRVSWYTCDCPWATKHCDEKHRASAVIPVSVLSRWQVAS